MNAKHLEHVAIEAHRNGTLAPVAHVCECHVVAPIVPSRHATQHGPTWATTWHPPSNGTCFQFECADGDHCPNQQKQSLFSLSVPVRLYFQGIMKQGVTE